MFSASSRKVDKVSISYPISQRQGSVSLVNISKGSEIVIMEAEWLLLPVWQQMCMLFLGIMLLLGWGRGDPLLTHVYWRGSFSRCTIYKKWIKLGCFHHKYPCYFISYIVPKTQLFHLNKMNFILISHWFLICNPQWLLNHRSTVRIWRKKHIN